MTGAGTGVGIEAGMGMRTGTGDGRGNWNGSGDGYGTRTRNIMERGEGEHGARESPYINGGIRVEYVDIRVPPTDN